MDGGKYVTDQGGGYLLLDESPSRNATRKPSQHRRRQQRFEVLCTFL